MKKLLTIKAVQALKGNDAAVAEILKALRKSKGNMREACELLGVGKSSMYRLITELDAKEAVDNLVRDMGAKVQGKVLDRKPQSKQPDKETSTGPRIRVRKVSPK